VLGAAAAAMVPWVFVLGRSLPETTQVRHWPTVWIGLDLAMALGCTTTACLVHRGDVRARLSASAVAALMVMDAWFDVLTAQAGTEFTQALVCAVPELVLAGLCTWLALRTTDWREKENISGRRNMRFRLHKPGSANAYRLPQHTTHWFTVRTHRI
jgi:hypothetical protein